MATIEKTASKRRPWQVRWRDPGGKQRKSSFARKADADRRRAEVEHSLNVGQYIDAAAGRQVFRMYAESWRAAQPVRHNTKARHERELRLHVFPVLGHRPLSAIRTSELQGFVTGLTAELSPASARIVWGTVRAIFRAAHRDRLVGFDPAEGVTPLEVHAEEIVPLTVEQVEALAEAIDPRYRAMVAVGAGCGLRQGEAFGLRVEDVDFLRREVRVAQQVQVVKNLGAQIAPVKSRSSKRTIPAAHSVRLELTEHLKNFRHPDSSLMFCNPAGRPLHRSMFNEGPWWHAREAAAGEFRRRARTEQDTEAAADLKRRADQLETAGFHDLRHFFASALIRYGLDVKTVAVRLGHSTPVVTLRTYSHLWPDSEDRSRAAVDAAFGYVSGDDVPQTRPAGGPRSSQVQVRDQKGGLIST